MEAVGVGLAAGVGVGVGLAAGRGVGVGLTAGVAVGVELAAGAELAAIAESGINRLQVLIPTMPSGVNPAAC